MRKKKIMIFTCLQLDILSLKSKVCSSSEIWVKLPAAFDVNITKFKKTKLPLQRFCSMFLLQQVDLKVELFIIKVVLLLLFF